MAELRLVLGRRRAALIAAVRELLPDATLPYVEGEPSGGYFLWMLLPEVCPDATDLFAYCADMDAKVVFKPGVDCLAAPLVGTRADAASLRRSVRLSFAFYEEDELREGVRRLSEAIRAYGGSTPSD